MKSIRTDIVSILDLRFARTRQQSELSSVASKELLPSCIVDRLNVSFSWLFYGEQSRDFELLDVSSAVPQATGAVLRISRRLGIGTCILWRTYGGDADALALKKEAWKRIEEDLRSVATVFEDLRVERFYPFVAIQVDADNIDDFATTNAEEIGRILTGDLEGERPAALRKYIEGDLSRRSYEKLLVRWTEAFALYSRMGLHGFFNSPGESEQKYEECMFRAVQVFEHCILARVSLLALAEQMEEFLRHLLVVTPAKWFKSRDLLASFSNIEELFAMYPRVQSVEADRLISDAHAQFGLDKVLAAAKAKQSELREQLEWAKAQTLGLLAFITYLLDKVVGWDNLRGWFVSGLHHVLR